ncbi:hypothetical protein HJC23_007767 [Cyclotella cryptica]|uniref:Peptidase M11 gametolysin domain-containing protein n=1 Tax=Cyclotella cryptica TaxID=29204 RepID=A0ABD3R2V5_9STRA
MNRHGFVRLSTILIIACQAQFAEVRVSAAHLENINENVSDQVFYHKRRRPISTTAETDPGYVSFTNGKRILCKSIIAIGKTSLWNSERATTTRVDAGAMYYPAEEEFVCERHDGTDVPIDGTEEQIRQLRALLNNGTLVSAESTIEVYLNDPMQAVTGDGQGSYSSTPTNVVIPPGNIVLKDSYVRRNERLTYEGQKPVLVVRVIDKNGLAVPEDANTISDKVFGTNGDTSTMSSQFDACSFHKLEIVWRHGGSIRKQLSAPGVLEVNIGVSLGDSDSGTVRTAMVIAAQEKLGFDLPGPFHHVMFVLEGCYYQDCGWAAYGVQMHEIGHNLNLAHSGGIDKQTYSDHTCLMGNPLYSDDVAKMCYNPAKSFQLAKAGAWYSEDHAISWDSGKSGGSSWAGRIIGAAEYDVNSASFPIAIKLITGSSRDLFVGFNQRAVGPNADNQQASDQVTIIEAGNGYDYAQSYLQATLASGQTQSFPNWRGSNHALTVTVNEINTAVSPGYAYIKIAFGPQPQPSQKPIRQSQSPTRKITGPPVLSTTYMPTYLPTSSESSELQTSNTGNLNKAIKGLMFTVKAKQDVTIRAFDVYARRITKSAVTIYSHPGTYDIGKDGTGWDLVWQATIRLKNKDTTNLGGFDVTIASGMTQSFFIYVDSGMMIKTTANAGEPFEQDEAIIIYEGTAFRREFHNVVGSGQYGGAIKYDLL